MSKEQHINYAKQQLEQLRSIAARINNQSTELPLMLEKIQEQIIQEQKTQLEQNNKLHASIHKAANALTKITQQAQEIKKITGSAQGDNDSLTGKAKFISSCMSDLSELKVDNIKAYNKMQKTYNQKIGGAELNKLTTIPKQTTIEQQLLIQQTEQVIFKNLETCGENSCLRLDLSISANNQEQDLNDFANNISEVPINVASAIHDEIKNISKLIKDLDQIFTDMSECPAKEHLLILKEQLGPFCKNFEQFKTEWDEANKGTEAKDGEIYISSNAMDGLKNFAQSIRSQGTDELLRQVSSIHNDAISHNTKIQMAQISEIQRDLEDMRLKFTQQNITLENQANLLLSQNKQIGQYQQAINQLPLKEQELDIKLNHLQQTNVLLNKSLESAKDEQKRLIEESVKNYEQLQEKYNELTTAVQEIKQEKKLLEESKLAQNAQITEQHNEIQLLKSKIQQLEEGVDQQNSLQISRESSQFKNESQEYSYTNLQNELKALNLENLYSSLQRKDYVDLNDNELQNKYNELQNKYNELAKIKEATVCTNQSKIKNQDNKISKLFCKISQADIIEGDMITGFATKLCAKLKLKLNENHIEICKHAIREICDVAHLSILQKIIRNFNRLTGNAQHNINTLKEILIHQSPQQAQDQEQNEDQKQAVSTLIKKLQDQHSQNQESKIYKIGSQISRIYK